MDSTSTGRNVEDVARGAAVSMTPREREIADMAADGMTIEEIGARTRLAPRTVGTVLYRVLPRLGVTTRRALRPALDRLDAVNTPTSRVR
ncbi:helix-turn-helix transcriptional regulator [Streptomyces sp. NPDC047046]|uniref:helix-turn-helix domain-containing protein n=1 Tax=Streptomyces sp. NPDC047046 TaxID=3155378 RepID=UPI0033CB333F